MEKTLKKGSWKGLFQKEWMFSKWEVLTLILLNSAVVTLLPFGIKSAVDIPQDFSDGMSIFTGLWLVVHMFLGLKLLFTSLKGEMNRPDVWLHSPASIYQIVGVKALFAAFVNAIMLSVGGGLLGISWYLNEANRILSLTDGTLVLISILIKIFLISIVVMMTGFLFLSIYYVVRSRYRNFTALIILLLFFVGALLLEKVRILNVFSALTDFGPVRLTNAKFYDQTNHNLFSLLVPDGVIFTIGGLFVYGGITAVLFILGAVLLEKKVRY